MPEKAGFLLLYVLGLSLLGGLEGQHPSKCYSFPAPRAASPPEQPENERFWGGEAAPNPTERKSYLRCFALRGETTNIQDTHGTTNILAFGTPPVLWGGLP